MNRRILATVGAAALAIASIATVVFAETNVPTQGPGLRPGLPAWYIAGTAGDPEGPLPPPPVRPTPPPGTPPQVRDPRLPPTCSKSIVCEMDGTRAGGVSNQEEGARVVWRPTPGKSYAISYPFNLPAGGGNVTGVGVDPQDNVWIWQRNQPDQPALFKFDKNGKMLFSVPPDQTNHVVPFRGHGMGVDGEGNAWVIDESGAQITKFSPEGKKLLVLGEKGHRGDWDDAKGQRLLWEPVTIDFGPQGDVYIFESHGDESPNDVGSADPTNNIGVARVIHLDKNAKFINQWYGNARGPGKFNSAHGSAVDPVTGDVWVGDRQDYRIVIFNANGQFIKTLQERNLICALSFDKHPGPRFGQLWLATGMDGQVVSLDRKDGTVMFVAAGTRKSVAPNHFSEATNMAEDSKGNLIVADTQVPRATKLTPPAAKK